MISRRSLFGLAAGAAVAPMVLEKVAAVDVAADLEMAIAPYRESLRMARHPVTGSYYETMAARYPGCVVAWPD